MGSRAAESRGEAADALSRGDVLRRGALAGGALLGYGALASHVSRAAVLPNTIDPGDVSILNYLLPFEYLQFKLYHRILSERNDKGEKLPLNGEEKGLFEGLIAQEEEHVSALRKMVGELGGKPIERGDYAYAFRYRETIFILANEIEGYAVGAYNYVIPKLKSKAARELACSIVQVDARHAATLLLEAKEKPAPSAFDYGANEQSSVIEIEKFTGPIIYREQGVH